VEAGNKIPAVRRVYEELGQRIRARRVERGLSQSKLAEYVELTRTSISNIENGRQHLPLHTLYRFADVLGCRPHDLLPDVQLVRPQPVEEALASVAGREDVKRFLEKVRQKKRVADGN
jgi:transcriptional regulator with XRE-family HTH domain